MVSYLRKSILSSASILIGSILISNVLNLIYNAYLGKTLTFSDFGLITLVNTFLYVFSIAFGSIASTVNHQVAYLTARFGREAGVSFHNRIFRLTLGLTASLAILWIALIGSFQHYFNLTSSIPLWAFLPILIFGFAASVSSGFAKGRFLFALIGIFNLTEALSKLLIAVYFVQTNQSALTYLSIPFSIVISSIVTLITMQFVLRKSTVTHRHKYQFSKGFFLAAVLTGFSTNAFLTFDILLTKHYFSATVAGQYAFLALVGKMIFFLGSLFNTFMIPFVSRDEGSHRDPNHNFYKLFAATSAVTLSACLGLILLGPTLLPMVFGSKALQVTKFLMPYSIALGLYTLSNSINTFHLARRHYFFSVIALVSALGMGLGIIQNHKSISDVINVILTVSIVNFLIVSLIHAVQRNGGFFLQNILDLYGLFRPLPKPNYTPLGKRILVFNWRDAKHAYAGGAEVYIHELGKRWVKEGNAVTLFCGNDGKSARHETVDGIRIIRRGGFYMVYFWALLYYVFKLRGKFDLIIDCENGVPFFTPLYAKEKKYLLIHHVHQEVFRKSLIWPLSAIATFLELKVMPYTYQNTQLITVSPSTKAEIISHKLTKIEPLVVFNGVDRTMYKPGKKSTNPSVLYLGRLQYYKSINVFIRVAKELEKKFPKASFVIAGEGEELKRLKVYAEKYQVPVTFLGKVSDKQKVKLLQEAWVVINPSSMEGWGLTVIEANACGTPVIASNVSGLKDSVKDSYSGYLIKHGDIKEFAKKTAKLINNKALRMKISKNAVAWSRQFNWDQSKDVTLRLFNNKDVPKKHVLVKQKFAHI